MQTTLGAGSSTHILGQLPFSGAEDNDGDIFYPPPKPPRYSRRDRRFVNPTFVTPIPFPGRHRTRRTRSPSSSSSYSSPVQERTRHRRSEKKKELKRKKKQRSPSPSPSPPPRRRNSSGLPGFIRLFLPSTATVTFVSVAVILVCVLYLVIRRDVASIYQTASHLVESVAKGPLEALTNGTATAVTAVWCGTLGWGCPGAREAALVFRTHGFFDLPTTPGPEQRQAELATLDVSLGNSFFDCLEDLGKIRGQKTAAAHLVTLAPKVQQWTKLLEHPDELYDDLKSLAQLRRQILLSSNAARVEGRNSIDILHTESQRTEVLSKNRIPHQELLNHINSVLDTTTKQLSSSAGHMKRTVNNLNSAEELTRKISSQIHREVARLRQSNIDDRSDILFGVKSYLAPGFEERLQERVDAVKFLKDVLDVVDSGVIVSLSSSLSLQQCDINTKHLNDALERTFALSNAKFDLSTRIRHISNGINPLKTRLLQYDESTSSKKVATVKS
ncbi:hypothetical protein FRC02_004595 [Tulasnella sp. 418]|nr:hypothetical protein FRC02_004595 [Tulasnella sp. 418]